jgi:hypothetical protein
LGELEQKLLQKFHLLALLLGLLMRRVLDLQAEQGRVFLEQLDMVMLEEDIEQPGTQGLAFSLLAAPQGRCGPAKLPSKVLQRLKHKEQERPFLVLEAQ